MRKTITLYITLFFLSLSASAGTSLLDSLNMALVGPASDTQEVNILQRLAWEMKDQDLPKAGQLIDKALKLAQNISYDEGLAKAYKTKGVLAWYKGDIDGAKVLFQKALRQFEKTGDKKEIANTINNIGLAHQTTGDYTLSIEQLSRALEIRKEIEDSAGMATSYNNLGVLYHMTGDFEKSLKFHTQALKIRQEIGDVKNSAHSYLNVGNIYMVTGDLDKALESFSDGLDIHQKTNNRRGMADAHTNIGDIYLEGKAHEEALEHYLEALVIREKLDDKTGVRESLSSIGKVHFARKDYKQAIANYVRALTISQTMDDKPGMLEQYNLLGACYNRLENPEVALSYLTKSMTLAKEIGALTELSKAYQLAADAHVLRAEFAEAYGYQRRYIEAKDSMFNQEKTRALVEMQTQYDVESKEREIDLLTKDTQIFQLQKRGLMIGLITLLFGGLASFFYYRYRVQTRSARILFSQKQEIEAQNRELSISNRDLEQFAYVVSHDLKQPLRTIGSYVGLIERRYKEDLGEDGQEFMDFITSGVRRMSTLLGDLLEYSQTGKRGDDEVVDLNDVMNVASQNLIQQIREENALVKVDPMPELIGNKNALVQLFQNLVSNAIKFRGDDLPVVEVGYEDEGDHHLISVRDNGIGIDEAYKEKIFVVFQRLHHTQDVYPGTGIGLSICQKVVKQHGGDIWVESNYGQGSTFFIRLPKRNWEEQRISKEVVMRSRN